MMSKMEQRRGRSRMDLPQCDFTQYRVSSANPIATVSAPKCSAAKRVTAS